MNGQVLGMSITVYLKTTIASQRGIYTIVCLSHCTCSYDSTYSEHNVLSEDYQPGSKHHVTTQKWRKYPLMTPNVSPNQRQYPSHACPIAQRLDIDNVLAVRTVGYIRNPSISGFQIVGFVLRRIISRNEAYPIMTQPKAMGISQ